MATTINVDARAGDLVVVCPDQLGPALARLVDTNKLQVVRYPDLGDPRFVDWADYNERLAGVDVAAVADRILATAGDHSIWLEWSDGYRIAGEQCADQANELVIRRPGTRPVVDANSVLYFEFA